ncbi:PAS domain-containing sensor histidine kinase [Anaeromyxobacter oryzae]|uniref:histidine kinase n=1 Tax=Anaeromyxobacter oryzae TaxID=2918170 RepID=A0ABN6MQ13_9BACT|nr:PAS domain-containing sensor histidine kinase [Anaeromyxobacter oryzae]BDG03084.1 hypothetical protein AMOR_20800 [Anaeromyxobacter oryzae]
MFSSGTFAWAVGFAPSLVNHVLLGHVLLWVVVALLVARVRSDRRRLEAQREEAQRALARAEDSERRFRLLAEDAPDVVYRYRLDPPGLEYVSPATTKVLGITPEEHYADPGLLRRIVLPEDLPRMEAALRAPCEAPLTLRWRRRDGAVICAEHRNVLIRDERGVPIAVEGIARDVTERVRVEAERERLVSEREDLLRAVSHDFRTPLQAVLLRAEALARNPGDPEKTTRTARAIVESARRMTAALQDVLHLARLTPDGLKPQPEPIPLAPFVQDLAQRVFADQGGARLAISLEPDAAVRADPAHLERILTNLIGNALKYSDAPSPVRIASEAAGAERIVVVADEGPGIPAEDLPRLFERYFRGTRPSRRQGTGLGLYVTRILTEAQGGAVTVESAPGHGAVFRVRLPAA